METGTTGQIFNYLNVIYWLVIALVIFIEAATFGVLWKRKENHRWTMGYFTVFLAAVPLVAIGAWDLQTWIGLFFAIGISGAVKIGVESSLSSWLARKLREADNAQANRQ